jgi:glyoxylase-like metal-dependent hydrolase (beta-lactamase superfamily II)
VHTPGHASNHLCFYLEEEQTLFTGDHIMEGSTVVIAPPDGDMLAYMNSLHQLKELPLRYLAPAHGNRIDNPLQIIEALIWHRTLRERKTLEKMQQLGPCTLTTLTPSVYDEVPAFLHGVAQMSLLAHLLKLEQDQVVERNDDIWRIRE